MLISVEIMDVLRNKILSKPMPRKRGVSLLPRSAEYVDDENSEGDEASVSSDAHHGAEQAQSQDDSNVAGMNKETDTAQWVGEGQKQKKKKKKKRVIEHADEAEEPAQKKKRKHAAEDANIDNHPIDPPSNPKKKKKKHTRSDPEGASIQQVVREHGDHGGKKKRDRSSQGGA